MAKKNGGERMAHEGPFTCKYCGREFQRWEGLVSHLKGCPERKLRAEFLVGQYVFYVIWNPTRRIQGVLKDMAREYGAINDYASFIAIMKFLKKLRYIDDYGIEKREAAQAVASSP